MNTIKEIESKNLLPPIKCHKIFPALYTSSHNEYIIFCSLTLNFPLKDVVPFSAVHSINVFPSFSTKKQNLHHKEIHTSVYTE